MLLFDGSGEEADDEGEGAGRYGDKFIELEISTRLRDLLLTMKRAAYYKIEDSLNLSSQYAQRIYYMLKLDEKTDIDVTIKEIKSRGRSRVRKIKFTITKKRRQG